MKRFSLFIVLMFAFSVLGTNYLSADSDTYRLRVSVTAKNGATGSVSGGEGIYLPGEVITITANVGAGSFFAGWNDGPCTGRRTTCSITMNRNQVVNANFGKEYSGIPADSGTTTSTDKIEVKVGKDGYGDYSGTITSSPEGISCGSDCSEKYTRGSTITLTATPAAGSRFLTWTKGLCPGTNVCTLPVETIAVGPTQTPLKAIFEKIATGGGTGGGTTGGGTTGGGTGGASYSWTITKSGSGSGTVVSEPAGISCGSDCVEFYNSGTSVKLTATPNAGSRFASWNDGICSGSKNTCTKVISGNSQANAVFMLNPVTDASQTTGNLSSDSASFSSIDLEMGMAHPSVITLQKYLNSHGYVINPNQGEEGSIGYETNYFGGKTKQALIKFQKDKGISPAQGFFGSQTRKAMGM